jgi:hypothetical protein
MKVYSSFFSKYKKGVKDVAKTALNNKTKMKLKTEDSSSLKGTLVSVFLLGFFLIISWVGVFLLFLERQ